MFENTGDYSAEELADAIGVSEFGSQGFVSTEIGLLLSDEVASIQQSGGTWSSITFLRWLPDWLTPIVWYAAAQLFALAVLPIAFVVFRPWPDGGYLFAKPLGLVLVATTAWLLVSANIVTFSFLTVLFALLIVAAVSYFVTRATGGDFLSHLKASARRFMWMELLWLVAFVAFLLVRAASPDLWETYKGGEKPMDFAYLNAVVRSTTLPPYDPW